MSGFFRLKHSQHTPPDPPPVRDCPRQNFPIPKPGSGICPPPLTDILNTGAGEIVQPDANGCGFLQGDFLRLVRIIQPIAGSGDRQSRQLYTGRFSVLQKRPFGNQKQKIRNCQNTTGKCPELTGPMPSGYGNPGVK